MKLGKLYDDFSYELSQRRKYLTEDSVRYIFFSCMLDQDKNTNNYILELPYGDIITSFNSNYSIQIPVNPPLVQTNNRYRQELDLYYEDNKCCYCFEIKFHRKPQKSTSTKTDNAGSLFNDIHRLQLITSSGEKDVRKFLVYVTDYDMHDYFLPSESIKNTQKSYRIDLKKFYCLTPNDGPQPIYINATPGTFNASANKSFSVQKIPAGGILSNVHFQDITSKCPPFNNNGGLHIRIYEIIDDDAITRV